MNTGQTVSQDEIDAILLGIGSLANDDLPLQTQTQPFDWQQLEHFSRSKLPGLDVVNARFARYLRDSLQRWWGCDVQVQAQALRQVPYNVALSTLPATARCASLQLTTALANLPPNLPFDSGHSSPRLQAVLVVDAALAFTAVDLALGGSAQVQAFNLTQAASPASQRLVAHLMYVLGQASCSAWRGWLGAETRLEGTAPLSRPLHTATASERMFVSSFQIQVGDHSGLVEIWYAWSDLEPLATLLANATAGDFVQSGIAHNAGWPRRMAVRLQNVRLPLAARWTSRPFSLAQLAGLGLGDVISLQGQPDIVVPGQGAALLNGNLIANHGQTALQVERWQ